MVSSFKRLVVICSLIFSGENYGQQKEFIRFNIKDLLSSQHKDSEAIEFLTKNTLTAKVLFLNKHHAVQSTCSYDAVFYVIQGKAMLKSGDRTFYIEKDSLVFVPRNTFLFFEVKAPLSMIKLVSLENKDTTRVLSE